MFLGHKQLIELLRKLISNLFDPDYQLNLEMV